jgi:hypothetical protein
MLFPLVGLYFPWWENWLGRNLVYFDYLVAFALLPATLHIVFGFTTSTLAYQWIILLSVAFIPIATVWRAIQIFRTQWLAVKRAHSKAEADKLRHELDNGVG